MGVVVALGLEGCGAGFQGGDVGHDVVACCDTVEGYPCRACGGGFNRRDGDVPTEVFVQRFKHHGGAALLALQAVAGDVGCGDDGFFQQGRGDVRLIFPAIESDVALPLQEGGIVGDGNMPKVLIRK